VTRSPPPPGRAACGAARYRDLVSRAIVRQLLAGGIRDRRVLEAFARVPRWVFVPEDQHEHAEEDRPLPIGSGQTISQPFVVAFMTEWLRLGGTERVLEIGTGSGYQAAILSLLAREVFSVEILPELADSAARSLAAVGATNVRLRVGDGRRGWPEEAPFDRIVVTAAPETIPEALLRQLAPRGRLVAPVGAGDEQVLRLVAKDEEERLQASDILPVRFVPLTGDDLPPATPSA
jgi:protein-L-isoaspartate(D-aspartate) O-methyltransferase